MDGAILMRLLAVILWAASLQAATYYVDYKNGNDSYTAAQASNPTKSTPWKHAPGMMGAAGMPAGFTPSAGDRIILKGCVIWPNSAIPWVIYGWSGAAGNLIYVGVDQTWWDNTVAGCSSAWNRPILDAQGQDLSSRMRKKAVTRPARYLHI